jgi:hypothetical protein
MEMNGSFTHRPPYLQRTISNTSLTGGWVGARAGLDGFGKELLSTHGTRHHIAKDILSK